MSAANRSRRASGWTLDRLEKERATLASSTGSLDSLQARQGEITGFRRAEIVLRRSKELGRTPVEGTFAAASATALREAFLQMEKAGADLLTAPSTFDVQALAEVVAGVSRPCGVHLDQADPRAAAEAALRAGATFLRLPANRVPGASPASAAAVSRFIVRAASPAG